MTETGMSERGRKAGGVNTAACFSTGSGGKREKENERQTKEERES